jgi:hypothetical protein
VKLPQCPLDELSEGFIAEIRELLDGHRLVY